MLGGGTIERVKGVILWLAWLVFAGSNKSVTKIKQHRKTFFVKITCQYSDVCLVAAVVAAAVRGGGGSGGGGSFFHTAAGTTAATKLLSATRPV